MFVEQESNTSAEDGKLTLKVILIKLKFYSKNFFKIKLSNRTLWFNLEVLNNFSTKFKDSWTINIIVYFSYIYKYRKCLYHIFDNNTLINKYF